jgi:hypothetical protein
MTTTFLPVATKSPLPAIAMHGFPYAGNAVKRTVNLVGVPLPPFGIGGIPIPVVSGLSFFPVKPLPGTTGPGAVTIGYPI